MPETEGKEEVVDGEIITIPTPKWDHAGVVHQLHMALMGHLVFQKVIVVTSIFGLMIRKKPLTCREPEARTFEVLQLQDGKLRTIQIVNSGQLRPLRFPETVVDVASVWPD